MPTNKQAVFREEKILNLCVFYLAAQFFLTLPLARHTVTRKKA